MDLLTWGRSPWGEWILTHISWDLLWASLFAGVAFLVAHGMAGVALVGLVMAHVYFAVRPRYATFISVLDRDAHAALAAMRLVSAQTSLSSQIIDNLNASIHVRALLTDLFLIDEILKQARTTQPAS
jgi:hypothetical protein